MFNTKFICFAGDVEFILDLKNYAQSVVTTHVCHLYALDMKNYERLVVRRNPKTIELLRQHAEVKVMSRVERMMQDNKVTTATMITREPEQPSLNYVYHRNYNYKKGTTTQSIMPVTTIIKSLLP